MLYKYLEENYKPNEPIFVSDIKIGIPGNTLRPKLKKLCDEGLLSRFDDGIYFIPKASRLKGGVPVSASTVAQYRYISRFGKVDGYYSGYTFANQVGMTLQVPHTIEIVSNEASARVRDVELRGQKIRLRKPRTTVTEENAKTLQFLDLLCEIDKISDEPDEYIKEQLQLLIRSEKITKADIDKYISLYPVKIYKNFYERGLYDVLT